MNSLQKELYPSPGSPLDFERAATVRPPLIDPYARAITYVRVSVTDRCDFRCVYCMAENMAFLPKADLLTLEELDRLCSVFVARGVRKLRLTGGEPLVRRGIMTLVRALSSHLGAGLDELTLTTNARSSRNMPPSSSTAGQRINSRSTRSIPTSSAPSALGELDKVRPTRRRSAAACVQDQRIRTQGSTRTTCRSACLCAGPRLPDHHE